MSRPQPGFIRVANGRLVSYTRSQEPDLQRWAEAYADGPVTRYRDKMSGKTMERPG